MNEKNNAASPRKRAAGVKLLALCTVAASLLAFSACDSTKANRDMDVVATVNGISIYRWEVDRQYDRSVDIYETTLSNQTGEAVDLDAPQNAEKRYEYRKLLVDMLVDDAIATEAAKKAYSLTAEEEAQVEAEYEQFVEDNIENIMNTQFEGDADGRKKAEELWAKNLQDNHMTPDSLKQSRYNEAVRKKLSENLHAEVAVSDEDLQATYEKAVDLDKQDYEADPEGYKEQYATKAAIPGNGTMFYNPPGFRRVKQIMISLPEDINNQIVDLNRREGELIMEQNAIAREKGQNDPALAELKEQETSLRDQASALYEEGFAAIQEKADEAYAKLQAGEDFDKLIEEYGDDPGMTTPPISEMGYLVGEQSKHLLPSFVTNAMSLENVGDTSELFSSEEGYHILKLASLVEEGPVSFEESKAMLKEVAEAQPRQDLIDQFVNEHREEYKVVINDSNI